VSLLYEQTLVDVPPAQGGRRLEDFLRAHGNHEPDIARLDLRLNFSIPGLPRPFTIQKSVIATFSAEPLSADMIPHYRVSWAPSEGGPFPLFGGTLSIAGNEDYEHFMLILTGSYEPPIGIAGGAFDALAGRFIARATARDLLAQIRDSIEAAFAVDEAAKTMKREAAVRSV